MTRRTGISGLLHELLTPRVVALVGALIVAIMTMSYDAPMVLLALLAIPAFVVLLVRPRAATTITLFLLYANVPVLASRLYGLPMLLAASAALLLGLPLAHHLIIRRQPILIDRTFGFMMIFLVVMATSAMLARAPEIAAARIGFYVLEGVVLYWLVINVVRDLPALRRVMWTMLAAGSMLGALSIYQAVEDSHGSRFGGLAHRDYEVRAVDDFGEATDVRISKRAEGPVDDANRFAQIMIVLLPMAMFAYKTTNKRSVKLLAAVTGMLVLAGVLLSYSRGAFLILVLLLAAATWVRWLRLLHVAAGAVAVMLALPYIAPTYHERIASLASFSQLLENRYEATTDGALRGRTTEMLAALHVFMDHPVLGVGPGNYTPVYSQDYQARHEVSFRDLTRPRRAHSLYLEVAAEMGIVGLVVFLMMVGLLLRDLWRARPHGEGDELSHLAVALAFCLAAYLGTGLFLHLSFERYFWLLLALSSAGLHMVERERRGALATDRGHGPASPARTKLGGPTRGRPPLGGLGPLRPAVEGTGPVRIVARSDDARALDPRSEGLGPRSGGYAGDPRASASRARAPYQPLHLSIARSALAAVGVLGSAFARVLSVFAFLGGALARQLWHLLVRASAPARSALEALGQMFASRYVYKLLDAVLTASVLAPEAVSLRRVLLPLRQANFKRVQVAMRVLDTRWPEAARRVRDTLLRTEILPFHGYLDPEPLAHGWNSTVFRLRPRGILAEDGGEFVVKVYRSSLGESPSRLIAMVRYARSRYRMLTEWYGAGFVPDTQFLVLQAPLLGTTAAACVQPRLTGRSRDLFGDVSDRELLGLLESDPELFRQFRHFVNRTLDAARTGICPDLMGRRNVLLLETPEGLRLCIVDTGIKDLDLLARTRPDVAREMRIRIARMERVLDVAERASIRRELAAAKQKSRSGNEPVARTRRSHRDPVPERRRLIVLTYHRVLPLGEPALHNPSLLSATPDVFEWQMRRLARDYRVVSLPEVLDAFRRDRPLPSRAVLITFDDAYRDVGEIAWPVMRRLGFPAAIFVPTAYPDHPERRFWWDRLARAFAHANPSELSLLLGGTSVPYWPGGWRRALRSVQRQIKALPHARAMELVERVLSQLGEPRVAGRPTVLGWSELRELAREGVTLCPHTRTHPALTRLSLAEAKAEVRGSIEDLRREIGLATPAFAYPFGDYDPIVMEVLRQEGIEIGFSIREGHNDVPGADPLRLHRTNVAPTSAHLLPLRLRPAGERIDRWRDRLRQATKQDVQLTTSPVATSGTNTGSVKSTLNGNGAPKPNERAGEGGQPNARAAEGGRKPVVAYLMSRFPKLTETFVLYEIQALDGMGVPVEVFPLMRERQAVTHPEAEGWVQRAHFHPFVSADILRAQWHFLKKDPVRYGELLVELVRRTWGSLNFLAGSLAIFPKTVRIAYEMQQRGVTHVHAHFANHPTAAAFIIHRLTGIPYSFTAHGSDLHVERRMLDAKVEHADFAVTISEYNREIMVKACGERARAKIHVVHCGVDPDVFTDTGESRGTERETFSLACVASFEEVKGHVHLVEACRILRDRGVDFRCHLVGTGPLRSRIEEQVARARLGDSVHFHGGLTRPQVASLLSLMDAAVLASQPTRQGKREGIPVALMEAMCAGLPVVATELSGIPELVSDGETGILVPCADALALANALQRLVEDPELRRRLGQAAKRKVRAEFDLRANTEKLLSLVLRTQAAPAPVREPSTTSEGSHAPRTQGLPGVGLEPSQGRP